MRWRYGLIETKTGGVGLHEVYVQPGPDKIPHSWTTDAIEFFGEDVADVQKQLIYALKDIASHPVYRIVDGDLWEVPDAI